ncbi:hypothetical protein RclHR1_07730009 [Rhizophagus clarus]|uniref:F-box domain-containing protein n=1 Tax=Rhizophagus clarus TaxID=94130 RepID=A0A2Z6RXX5_9GLOM|nr:hypothetical protein RclHR1_07730009 [Rhizophagus clarus]GES74603.1 hypothetical protein GLOIN_2v1783316 [Rhizophagus clarus]
MSNLNRDILYLIFKQLQDDKRTLLSCLLVNKTWCETTVPILWKNPWNLLKNENETLLLSVIISHLSNLSRNKIGEHKLLINSNQKPTFNYIIHCKHLDLDAILMMINKNFEKSRVLDAQNEIFNLFINENMNFTHLYIRKNFDNQIQFIHGAERCFSGIKFLSCDTGINDNIVSKLTETCKLIKELQLFISNVNYGIVKLIESQGKLLNIDLSSFLFDYESSHKIYENSLIKHASTIQCCRITRQPSIKFLSSFVNLKELELGSATSTITSWSCLGNLSFPFLQILRSSSVPIGALTCLIKNTSRFLTEIKIDYVGHDEMGNKFLIQAIYQNCPNLKYLKIMVRYCNILELETLLISCQYLDGLFLIVNDYDRRDFWNELFKVLTKSSSIKLFKFKFYSYELPRLNSLKLFFDNWRGRHPMLLQFISDKTINLKLIERYKAEGIIKKFDYDYIWGKRTYKNFEWI